METGNFSGLRNGNWKFYDFHSVKRKFPVSIYTGIIPEFRFTQQISGSFHFQNENFFPEKWKPYVVRMTLLLWVLIVARAYNYIKLTLYIEIAEV